MSSNNEDLARFAAAFLANYRANDEPLMPVAPTPPRYPGITTDAGELLRAVDAGGVPAFVTENLRRIAAENGIAVNDGTRPNEIVDALRSISDNTRTRPP